MRWLSDNLQVCVKQKSFVLGQEFNTTISYNY